MRDEVITDWLAGTAWAGWTREPLAGDASSRRYERLRSEGASAILMIAPPEICGSLAPFTSIAGQLREHGLAAPEVYLSDDALGLMVLEDLGETDFAKWCSAHPQDERALYAAAVDVLIALGNAAVPADLKVLTPETGAAMIDLFFEWHAPDCSADLASDITRLVEEKLAALDPQPLVMALRDFHAENLIWRPESAGLDRVGLLDFQDAFAAPAAYDLASLLRDARRDVTPETVDYTLAYFAEQSGTDPEDLHRAFATLSVQRNLRILGIFSRLAQRDGKQAYLRLIPRVRTHIETDLSHPSLADLAPLIRRALPAGGDA